VKIKYDVSGVDPADSVGGSFEDPKPGVYKCKVKSITHGFSKGDDGKPDKSRARLEVVYELLEPPYKGSRLWDYLSFSEAAQWRLDQFLQAVGVTNAKKRKGEFDTDELVGMPVRVRVKGETQTVGGQETYRARVGAVLPGEDEDLLLIDDEDEIEEVEDDEEIDEVEDEDPDADEDEEVGDDEEVADGYTQEDLEDLTIKELGELLMEEFEVERSDVPKGKDSKIQMILELQGGEEEGAEEENNLEDLSMTELKALAKELEVSTTGSKNILIKRIKAAQEEDPF